MRAILIAAALVLTAQPAAAEVVARSENGFTLRFVSQVAADADRIPASLEALPHWWDGAHSYTGEAANLSLDLKPGGCWCEKMPDGTSFDHGRTTSVQPDRMLFHAPFGPLRGRATRSDLEMTWRREPTGLTLVWTMTVEGVGVGAMADPVDAVMAAGFRRWATYLETFAA
ncbi:MAG: hypothetical protein K2X07_09855 [Caulobacteraceae bacterium]|nr:hypothetical protein [Caulobacteraceae bacterium]